MQLIDNPRGAAYRIRDPRLALAHGELHVDDVSALEIFDQSFRFTPDALERARSRYEADTGIADVKDSAAAKFTLRYLMDEAFVGSPGPSEKISLNIVGEGQFTVAVSPDEFRLSEGFEPDVTARMVCSRDTFCAMTLYKLAEARSLYGANNNGVGRELSDHQLASVAGGKGSDPGCFGDTGCGGDILVVGCRSNCDSDYYCPADYDACPHDVCGVASCMTDVGIGGVCGADGCGADVGGGGVCSADGCLAAACGADACHTAACAADACTAAACPYDACGAAACWHDACALAACSANACGAASCGADIAQGPCAWDACFVNVLPN